MKRSVIFDIDGTLADCSHRRHFLTGCKTDWKNFNQKMYKDELNKPVANLLKLFYENGHDVLLVTGRMENKRAVTAYWLLKHNLVSCITQLYMRANNDYRSDDLVKQELLQKIRAEGFDPWVVVDDRNSVVKMWRENGLLCLQCAEGDF